MDNHKDGEKLSEATLAQRRELRAVHLIEKSDLLKQAFHLEPRLYDVLKAATSHLVVHQRHLAYSTFKKQCESLVGFHAARPELRTAEHYLALLDLLCVLLSWVKEQPRLATDLDLVEDPASEEWAVNAAVSQSMAASREASLLAFKDIAEGQR